MSVSRQTVAEFAQSVGSVDAFICCASYEDRCRSVPDALDPQLVQNVLLVENVNLRPYIADNATRIRNRFAGHSIIGVESRTDDPIVFADAFRTSLARVLQDRPQTLLVDITTFTHESLLVMLKLYRLLASSIVDIVFCYVDAAEYAYKSKAGSKWLSKGVADIRSVLGLPRRHAPAAGDAPAGACRVRV